MENSFFSSISSLVFKALIIVVLLSILALITFIISFTDFGDVESVIEFILDYRLNPEQWAKRREVGKEKAISVFSSRSVSQEYIDFYKKIMKR